MAYPYETINNFRAYYTGILKAHIEAKTAWDNGATEEQMKPILDLIRQSQ